VALETIGVPFASFNSNVTFPKCPFMVALIPVRKDGE
jgi:hypothetical protein